MAKKRKKHQSLPSPEPILGLTACDYWRLLRDALVTVMIVLFIYIGIIYVIEWSIDHLPDSLKGDWSYALLQVFGTSTFNQYHAILLVISFLVLLFFVAWRVRRRRRIYELQHVIDELQYIARGNYNYRIQGDYGPDLDIIVKSINQLVDSTREAMEEEREAERTKEELMTNISHDLRTPLTSIIGYLGLIESGQYASEEELRAYSHVAFEKAQQLKRLVDEMFDYASIGSSGQGLSFYSFDLVQLLSQLIADFEIQAQDANKSLRLETDQESLLFKADAEKLVRVFQNLLANACKYGKGGDQVVVSLEDMETYVRIRVANNGQVLDEKSKAHLFDRFYRGDKSRSPENKGSGLGLSIAKGIVEAHNGQIDVETTSDWTIFNVYLPKYSV